MLRKITRAGSIALVLVAGTLGALALRPGTPPVAPGVLFPGAMIDRPTLHLFERSCQNCHSENTVWPWYSRIPPASWIIAKDIREARSHVNFSNWNSYSAEGQQDLLTQIGSVARTGRMPPSRYTFCTKRRFSRPGNASLFTNGAERRRNGFMRPSASPPDHSVKRYNTAWSGEGKPV